MKKRMLALGIALAVVLVLIAIAWHICPCVMSFTEWLSRTCGITF